MRASSGLQFGALREGGGTREAGSTVAESLVVLYRVGTHQIRRRRKAARSSTSQGRAEPLCARITGLNREVSEGKADVLFLPTKATRSGERARFVGLFQGCTGLLDDWMLARAPASPAQGLHHHGPRYFNFLIFVQCVALGNLDLLIKTGWSAIGPVYC